MREKREREKKINTALTKLGIISFLFVSKRLGKSIIKSCIEKSLRKTPFHTYKFIDSIAILHFKRCKKIYPALLTT